MRLKLKLARVKQGLNQTQFAEKMNYTQTYYSLIESGTKKGSRKFWRAVKDVCNVDESTLNEMKENL